MSTNAVPITVEQMDALLAPMGFRTIALEGTRELVYAKGFHRTCADGSVIPCSLRVYSSIVNGISRGIGEDAIRVSVWASTPRGIIMLGGAKRVHRVENWRNNLCARLADRDEIMRPFCPICGAPALLRKPKAGASWTPFYGCLRFPVCNGNIPT